MSIERNSMQQKWMEEALQVKEGKAVQAMWGKSLWRCTANVGTLGGAQDAAASTRYRIDSADQLSSQRSNTDMIIERVEKDLFILRIQFSALLDHLNLRVERGYNQMGPDECITVWEFKEKCKECGK